jgi:hypothetical protein
MNKKKRINLAGFFKSIPNYVWSNAKSTKGYWLTRFVFLRLLGLIYLVAFLSLAFQALPLIGEDGLLPAQLYLDKVGSNFESSVDAFIQLPTIFIFGISDNWILILSWIGVILSLVLLTGYANVISLFLLWFLYMSFVHIGQLWYSFGWEIQLLETGFLAMFIVPLWDARPFPRTAPPVPVIWLLRWLTFRIHLGAGLIKIRGDECWRDLTCLYHHYESQPIPNPLSPYFHFLPKMIHKIGVLWNHFIELIVPFFIFWPRRGRHIAGILLLSFHLILILSGNLSFLNWLTIVAIIGCFDDTLLRKIMPKFITKKADMAAETAKFSRKQFFASLLLVFVVVFLSVPVINNLFFSSSQVMNTSYNRLHLVNTYGAFGSVGEQRYELIISGSDDGVDWKEYDFKAKPGPLDENLAIIAPYHLRIDWLIWFAAMSTPNHYPWTINFVWKLLHNDPVTLSLIEYNPFPDKSPKYIKVDRYIYRFEKPGSENKWTREFNDNWLPPLSADNPELVRFIKANGWG